MSILNWSVASIPDRRIRDRWRRQSRYQTLSLSVVNEGPPAISYADDVVAASEALCADIADDECLPVEFLHLKGMIAARNGYHHIAAAYLKRAARLAPSASRFADLADVLVRQGEAQAAVDAALASLALNSKEPAAYRRLGLALEAHGVPSMAVAVYRQALHLDPASVATLVELGDALLAMMRHLEAIEHFEAALILDPGDLRAHHGLAQAWRMRGDAARALSILQHACALEPEDAGVRTGIGELLIRLGRYEEAVHHLRVGLTLAPAQVSACRLLVAVLELLGWVEESSGAWLALGEALQLDGDYEEAAFCYRQAITRKPNSLPSRLRLAHVMIATRQPQETIALLEPLSKSGSQALAVHVDLGTARYLVGDTDGGWDHFTHHYDAQESVRRAFEQPVWDGSHLHGRKILLWASDGRGDVIQFLRYAKFARDRGGHVIMQCHHPSLIPLIQRMPTVDRVLEPSAPIPSFDVHAPLVFMPAFVRSARELCGDDVPYLRVDPERVEMWRDRLRPDGRRLVGLSWGGEPTVAPSRFIALELFGALGGTPGVRFISMQHGPQAAELLSPPEGLHVERWMTARSSIDEAAALVANLDLVISVDTMIAHLAGALGKPVFVLLRYAPNWRWQLDDDRTDWYPTMRLFRQPRAGDWEGVIANVRQALHEW